LVGEESGPLLLQEVPDDLFFVLFRHANVEVFQLGGVEVVCNYFDECVFGEAEVSVGLQGQHVVDETVDVEELLDSGEVRVGLLHEGGLVLHVRGHLNVLGVVNRGH